MHPKEEARSLPRGLDPLHVHVVKTAQSKTLYAKTKAINAATTGFGSSVKRGGARWCR